jgi:outer membrane protein OmpA-like peptidoglycan-associated protein
MTSLTRRRWLALGVGAVVVPAARFAHALGRDAPRTLDDAVAAFETLISPEALAHLAATPDARLPEYERGFDRIRALRWHEGAVWPIAEGPVGKALEAQCEGLGFRRQDLTAYLITTLARRHSGRGRDVAAQIAQFHEIRAREEKEEGVRRKAGVHVFKCRIELLDQFYFAAGAATPRTRPQELIDAIAATLIGNPQFLEVEAQGHASAGEPRADELSRARALDVVAALVRAGLPASRLTAHGLGARFRNTEPNRVAGRDRDRRVELVILRVVRPDV